MNHLKSLSIIFALAALIILPGLLFAQTTNTKPLPTDVTPNAISGSAPTNVSSVKKCGVNTYRVSNDCGVGAFKDAYVQCYDGYEETLGGESSCKSSEVWQKYAAEACSDRCGITGTPQPAPGPKPLPTPAPTITPIQPTVLAKPVAICYIPDKLTKDYNQLILDLRKAEEAGDKETAELIIKKITALKLEIERTRKECLANTSVEPKPIQPPTEAPRPLAPVAIDRCLEVSQWENKIAYYQKLAGLSDTELKEQTGFSRDEIEKILADLPSGLVKVREQCTAQNSLTIRPDEKPTVLSQSIAEPIKPVAVESGGEVVDYYKAKIEKITAEGDAEAQVTKLKSLKTEIDELIVKLIKGRKEIEVSELGGVVSELKVSRGEIRADGAGVKTTDKKILISVSGKPISVEPTARQVEIIEIKDGDDMKVTAEEVSIKDGVLSVGNAPVKLAPSEIAGNLGVSPQAVELKEENAKAVYKLKVAESRKLFGFIPISVTKTLTADAQSSNLLDESLPWYSFLTTR